MKILLFSDLHCDEAAARSLVQRAPEADLAIGAGDFANARRGLHLCLDVLRALPCPVLFVPGNNESFDELNAACAGWPQARVLHGSGITFQNTPFWGIGGGIPITPFGSWSFDFDENQARDLLRDCPVNAVLISHSPPKGAVDVASNGKSLGSVAVRETIEQKQPRLVVCGHIHGSAGQWAKVENTPVVNAGPSGLVWEI